MISTTTNLQTNSPIHCTSGQGSAEGEGKTGGDLSRARSPRQDEVAFGRHCPRRARWRKTWRLPVDLPCQNDKGRSSSSRRLRGIRKDSCIPGGRVRAQFCFPDAVSFSLSRVAAPCCDFALKTRVWFAPTMGPQEKGRRDRSSLQSKDNRVLICSPPPPSPCLTSPRSNLARCEGLCAATKGCQWYSYCPDHLDPALPTWATFWECTGVAYSGTEEPLSLFGIKKNKCVLYSECYRSGKIFSFPFPPDALAFPFPSTLSHFSSFSPAALPFSFPPPAALASHSLPHADGHARVGA